MSKIPRAPISDRKIVRQSVTEPFRTENEVEAAMEQIGGPINGNSKDWYQGIYLDYHDNEC